MSGFNNVNTSYQQSNFFREIYQSGDQQPPGGPSHSRNPRFNQQSYDYPQDHHYSYNHQQHSYEPPPQGYHPDHYYQQQLSNGEYLPPPQNQRENGPPIKQPVHPLDPTHYPNALEAYKAKVKSMINQTRPVYPPSTSSSSQFEDYPNYFSRKRHIEESGPTKQSRVKENSRDDLIKKITTVFEECPKPKNYREGEYLTSNKSWTNLQKIAKQENNPSQAYLYSYYNLEYTLYLNRSHQLLDNDDPYRIVNAVYNLSCCILNLPNFRNKQELVFKLAKLAADAGLTNAQISTGYNYMHGEGCSQNLEESLRYYELAANQGNAKAQKVVGFKYYNGEGTNKSVEKAIHYHQLAAAQGDHLSLYFLGNLYFDGREVKQDKELAIQYYIRAADKGSEKACSQLSSIYSEGTLTKVDQQKANYYQKKYHMLQNLSRNQTSRDRKH